MPVTDTQCLCVTGLDPKPHGQDVDHLNLLFTLSLGTQEDLSNCTEKHHFIPPSLLQSHLLLFFSPSFPFLFYKQEIHKSPFLEGSS